MIRLLTTSMENNRAQLRNHNESIDLSSDTIIGLISNRGTFNITVICLILLAPSEHTYASGFAVLEQSVSGLGKAYSGGTVGSEDISTIFYNPAGLSEYMGTEIISGTHLILPEARFKVDSSFDSLNRPLTGSDGTNSGKTVFIPNLYLATDLRESFRFGLGITVPFGSNIKYLENWKGRYESINSQLKTFDINPVISYALNNKFTLGFGLSAQYAKTKLSNAIDFGTICIAEFGTACSGLGLSPQATDGKVEIKADGWSWGYNAGVLFKPIDGLRLGIAYRSKVSHRLKGEAKFTVPTSAQIFTSGGAFKNSKVVSESDLPANLAIGVSYNFNEKWTILTDIIWTHWNVLQRVTIDFENPSQPSSTLNFVFKNTIRTSFGLIYRVNSTWTIRSGFAFDESPVRNAQTRTLQTPDSDRYWLAFGLGFRPNSNLKFNLGYAHIFFKDALVQRKNSFGHNIQGSVVSQADIISAELHWTF